MITPEEFATLNDQAHAYYKSNQKPVQKKKKGNLLSSLLPTLDGAAGAVGGAALGTAIFPGIGTILGALAGGAAGGAGGKVAQNKVEGNKLSNGVAGAAIENGVLGAGPLRLAKLGTVGAKAGITAAKGGEGLAGALTAASERANQSVFRGKLAKGAADRSAKGFGNEVGATVKGRTVTPQDADVLQTFIDKGSKKYGGIKAGNPAEQARQAQAVHNTVISKIDETLGKINRPLSGEEIATIGAKAADKVAMNAGVTGSTNTLMKFTSKLAQAKDLKGLEAIRREADDLAYTSNAAGKTAKAAQAKDFRDAVDEFITPLSKEYKSVKGDYGLSKQALESTSKAVKSAKGVNIPVPFTNMKTPAIGTATVRNKANDFLTKLPTAGNATGPTNAGIIGRTAGVGIPQAGITAAMQPQQPASLEDALNAATSGGMQQDPQATQSASPYSRENLLADMQRDPAHADDYLKLYQQYEEVYATDSGQPELTASQQTRAAAAQNALLDFPLIEDAISNGKLGAAKALPGSGTQLGRRLLGTEDLDAALFNIADNILRARSGAAAPEAEVLRFKNTFLPGPLDSEDAKRTKLQRAMRELQGYVNPKGAAGGSSTDLADALMQAGYN